MTGALHHGRFGRHGVLGTDKYFSANMTDPKVREERAAIETARLLDAELSARMVKFVSIAPLDLFHRCLQLSD